MKAYKHGTSYEDDILLAGWFMRMRADGDLERTFMASAHTLSGFYTLWPGAELIFDEDEDGITVASWVSPLFGSRAVMHGAWVRSDKRAHVGTLRTLLDMYRMIFNTGVTAIVGVTKQEPLLAEHRKLGYQIFGEVPGLWGNESAWIAVLTPEAFAEASSLEITPPTNTASAEVQ